MLPGNSILPFLLAIVTSLSFLAPLFGAHLVSALALVGVAGLAVFWAWTSGRKVDEGPVDAGLGQILPTSHEVPDPPGWWGSLLLLLADGVHFGSLLFGYAFLWTIAPNWPPPSWITPGLVGPILAGAGARLDVRPAPDSTGNQPQSAAAHRPGVDRRRGSGIGSGRRVDASKRA
ncbi:hypothetical protein ACFP8Z_01490 [Gemmobacter lanyuensis]|uniref:hypothetical protein n=1 Tax=Gemmobacter lanyuensis TaxID=1054497 RepID=UPI00361753AF